jgi:hypothetical protein
VSFDGTQSGKGGASFNPQISADGRYVVFNSSATNLVVGDTNNVADVFRRDRQTRTTELVNVGRTGGFSSLGAKTLQNGAAFMTPDARFITFTSRGNDLVSAPVDTNNNFDIFVRDMQLGKTIPVSVTKDGARMGLGASALATISSDGRYVLFSSAGLENFETASFGTPYVWFVRDISVGITQRIELNGVALKDSLQIGPTVAFLRDGTFFLIKCVNPVPGIADSNTMADCLLLPAFPPKIVNANLGSGSAGLTLKTMPGLKHQLQTSRDLVHWTNTGDPFTAPTELYQAEAPFDAATNGFFRFITEY